MIPYGRQTIDEDDIQAVTKVLRGNFLTTGPEIQKFEKSICAVTGARYSIACSNGTTALHLAGLALNLHEGDAVIVPSLTFLATANVVRYCNAEVVFADVDPYTGLMRACDLEDALTRCGDLTPRAVFAVHLTGQAVNLQAISEIAKANNLKIVADAAHAIGGFVHDTPVGSCEYEDFSTFSFHPVKTIAMGEGGAVTTNNKEHFEKMARLRHHGMRPTPDKGTWAYEMVDLGYNYRVTDMQCALGISQLKKIEQFVERRHKIVSLYDELLKPLNSIIKTPKKMDYCNPAWHLYAVQIDFKKAGVSRQELMSLLRDKNIGTQVHYIPVHHQPYYKNRYGDIALSGADNYYERTLSLPLYPAMSNSDVQFIASELIKIIGTR